MATEEYVLELRCFTWDSDHYDEPTRELVFPTFADLNDFCRKFWALPNADDDMPYFGKFKEMKDVTSLLAQYGKGSLYDGGGVGLVLRYRKVTRDVLTLVPRE